MNCYATFGNSRGSEKEYCQYREIYLNMPGRKRIPMNKATIRALKSTTHLTLDEIALRCGISKTSVQRIASTKDKVSENHSLFCGRKKKLTLEQEALILTSILELRKEEGSFSSRCLVERTGIRHVTDRSIILGIYRHAKRA